MNQRDAAFLAHLDAIETRWTTMFTEYHTAVITELRLIRDDIAGLKLDLATHHHDGGES
jgi:hypothetical protein